MRKMARLFKQVLGSSTASSLSPCYRSGGVNGSNIDGSPSYALLEAESPAHNASLVDDGEEVSKS